jgi:acetoin:2,6-dichlorophenolindophenol oxidoreductase subunit alpha
MTSTRSRPAPADATRDAELLLRLYRTMVECRAFEVRAQELFFEGLVRGTTHLGVGQEAVAAGFAGAMRRDDYTFATYRGHNHALARGAPMGPLYAELFGRANGILGGKGGSMHITSVEHGMMGSYAIVGAHLPIALGAAWSAQYRKSGQVAVCFFGDGATNIGAFHEALNMAVVWKAPVVFVCENNRYMEYTPIGSVTAVERPAADRAAAYGLQDIVVDGNDVEAVHETASRAIEQARSGGGPSLVEALTYRQGGHSRADPGKYRPDDEVKEWLARDPIPLARRRLEAAGVKAATIDAVDDEAAAKVAAGEEEARNGPEPGPEVLETQVWADGGSAWRSDQPSGAGSDRRAPIETG